MERKHFRQLEKITKGIANHRRIEVLYLLEAKPNLSLSQISNELGVNFKTVAEHVRRLVISGLVWKNNIGKEVQHKLSDSGAIILKFLRTLE